VEIIIEQREREQKVG